MKKVEYTFLNQPVSPRTYRWLWFICPGIALWIMLASRRVVGPRENPSS
ncbi:MAG: hypothetical protein QM790_20670 [Nibricoccus sp.]